MFACAFLLGDLEMETNITLLCSHVHSTYFSRTALWFCRALASLLCSCALLYECWCSQTEVFKRHLHNDFLFCCLSWKPSNFPHFPLQLSLFLNFSLFFKITCVSGRVFGTAVVYLRRSYVRASVAEVDPHATYYIFIFLRHCWRCFEPDRSNKDDACICIPSLSFFLFKRPTLVIFAGWLASLWCTCGNSTCPPAWRRWTRTRWVWSLSF